MKGALAAGVLAAAVSGALFLILPEGGSAQSIVLLIPNAVALVLASLVAVRSEGRVRSAWGSLSLGLLLYLGASCIFYSGTLGFDFTLGYPSFLDVTYFLSYLGFGGFFLMLLLESARSETFRQMRGAVLDALVVAAAGASLLYVLIIEPVLRLHTPALTTATSVAHPAFLIFVSGLATQLLIRRDARLLPGLLVGAWIVPELIADVWYARASIDGSFAFGHQMFLLWLFAYWALSCAALLVLQGQPFFISSSSSSSSRSRFPLLAGAAAVPFLAVVFDADANGIDDHLIWIGVVMSFVLARVYTLMGDVETEQTLRRHVESLIAKLHHQSQHDSLTGLLNRGALGEALARALVRRREEGRVLVLFLVDLDGFKAVNDTHGHDIGDRVLVDLAASLKAAVRPSDVVARLGGDEFAVIVDDIETVAALEMADRLRAECERTLMIEGLEIAPRLSLGATIAGMDESVQDVLKRADVAMYAAKTDGGGVQIFDERVHQRHLDRYQLILALRASVPAGELVLHYQPIVDLVTRQVIGVEALLRWDHPTRGLLGPFEFMDAAEESGAIVDIGRWVLKRGCADAKRLQTDFPDRQVPVSINVSRRQLHSATIVDDVIEALNESEVDPRSVTLEVTETALMEKIGDLIGTLLKLKAAGVSLAMDDFGTGYSSLSQLRELPIDVLKVDRAFVTGIALEDEEWALASAILKLATSLGKRTVAEGIELPAQLVHLRSMGCTVGQGFLFARPMPYGDLENLFREEGRPPS